MNRILHKTPDKPFKPEGCYVFGDDESFRWHRGFFANTDVTTRDSVCKKNTYYEYATGLIGTSPCPPKSAKLDD